MPFDTPRHPARTFALVVFVLILSLATGATAQRYEWRDVEQVATIQPDGSVVVDDARTLWTDDDFGEAFICFELDGRQSIELLPGSGAVSPGPAATAFAQGCSAGRELVVRNETRVSERRVRFVYRLTGVTEYFSDVAQFYWNMVQLDHPTILGYSLTVRAPGPMALPYDAYVHRYSNIERPLVSLSDDRSTLTVQFDRIPSGSGVEVRYLMDPALFTQKSTVPGMQRLLEDEARVAGLDERRAAVARERSRPVWALLPVAVLLWYASGVRRTYRRVGREPQIESMQYPFEPPADRPAAAVTAMLMQSFNPSGMGPAFQATIMDLARKGYGEFRPKGKKFEMQLNSHVATSGLNPLETSILGYLQNAAKTHRGDPDFLTFSELRSYSQRYAGTFMPKWSKYVRDWVETELGGPLVEAESRKLANRWYGLSWVATLLAVGGAFLFTGLGQVVSIVVAIVCFILGFVAAGSIPAWRPEVAREVYGWQGFKRTLSDYTTMKDAPLDFFKLWDKYYVYAAALGVADKFLKALSRAAPLHGIDETTMIRQASWMGVSHGSVTSLGGLSQSISSLSSALSAASASASSGGSSSGGGGGGGGGGSSGGR